MTVAAIVPVKNLSEAKSRLSTHLNPDERKRLVFAMLQDVLRAIWRSEQFGRVIVVSPDAALDEEAHENHAAFLHQNGTGLNAAIHQAARYAMHQDISSLVTVLADLPLSEPRDFEEILALGKGKTRVVLSPSLKGGTNVMVKVPPDIIGTAYGRWSYAKHLRIAQKKGILVYSISNSRLSFDVDTIQDLRTLRHLDNTGRTNAGRVAREIGHVSPLLR